MTYCVGLLLRDGMVLLSDTRTNGGMDNVATYRKLHTFEEPGERVIAIMTAGSLSISQITLARLRDAVEDPEASEATSILKAPTMLRWRRSSATCWPRCATRWMKSCPR